MVTPRAERPVSMPRDKPGYQAKREESGALTKYSLFPKRWAFFSLRGLGKWISCDLKCCRVRNILQAFQYLSLPRVSIVQHLFFIFKIY